MKKLYLFITIFLSVSMTALGQRKQTNYVMPYLEYGYNYTFGHYGSAAAVADFSLAKNLSVGGGLLLSTANYYSADLRLNYEIPLQNSAFHIETRYLARWFVRNKTQEYTLALSAGFMNYHWKFQFGLYGRFSGVVEKEMGNRGMFFEPFGITYLGEGKLFRENHSWNIGGRISNVNYFMIERVTMPLFTLLGDARIGEKMRLFGEITLHPSGVFNIQAQFYGIMAQVGIKYLW